MEFHKVLPVVFLRGCLFLCLTWTWSKFLSFFSAGKDMNFSMSARYFCRYHLLLFQTSNLGQIINKQHSPSRPQTSWTSTYWSWAWRRYNMASPRVVFFPRKKTNTLNILIYFLLLCLKTFVMKQGKCGMISLCLEYIQCDYWLFIHQKCKHSLQIPHSLNTWLV